MERGYIKLWRKSIDSGIMQNSELWTFWCWCLLKASHKKKSVMVGMQKVELNPGDFVFGRSKAASFLKINESKIFRMTTWLKSNSMIDIKSNNKFSIISIINWSDYQEQKIESEQQTEQQTEQQVNIKRTASEQQVNTNKNVNIKELKNEKNKNIYTADFLIFWTAYPKKTGKDAAWSAWQKRNGTRPDISILIEKIKLFKTSEQWIKDGGQYIPNPATWINQGRWNDELPQIKHYDQKTIHNLMVAKQFLEDANEP